MSRFDRPADVPVPIGVCLCPGTPHGDGDVVYLSPQLSAPGGMAAQGAIGDASNSDGVIDGVVLQELLWKVYRDHGIVGWNLVDEDGDPVPLTSVNKEAGLPYAKGGRKVADAADELYSEDVLAPFRERVEKAVAAAKQAKRSLRGSTNGGPKATSPTPITTRTRPKPSSTPDTEPEQAGA